ncbi:MAG: carbohydrate-binding family 9-like protein [Bacteriovoracaceae bacterium]|nr:carbohydrate-binding family 9-like protein [Bacteroidota bacterium]
MQGDKIISCRHSEFSSINKIDESALANIDFAEQLVMADGTEPPASIDTRVGIEWNDNGLLVFFHGRFDTLRLAPDLVPMPAHAKTHNLWELSDVYEVFIGVHASQSKLYKEFQVSPEGRWLDIDVNKQLGISNHYWYSGLQCCSFVDNEMKIWSSIIELPWNCFGLHTRTEDVWHANFYRASGTHHGDELMAWSPTGYGEKCFHRSEHFGTIQFER